MIPTPPAIVDSYRLLPQAHLEGQRLSLGLSRDLSDLLVGPGHPEGRGGLTFLLPPVAHSVPILTASFSSVWAFSSWYLWPSFWILVMQSSTHFFRNTSFFRSEGALLLTAYYSGRRAPGSSVKRALLRLSRMFMKQQPRQGRPQGSSSFHLSFGENSTHSPGLPIPGYQA